MIEPKNDIAAHIANHFADRFNNEWFIIYDARHHKAVFHDVSGRWEVRLLTEDEEEKIRVNDERRKNILSYGEFF